MANFAFLPTLLALLALVSVMFAEPIAARYFGGEPSYRRRALSLSSAGWKILSAGFKLAFLLIILCALILGSICLLCCCLLTRESKDGPQEMVELGEQQSAEGPKNEGLSPTGGEGLSPTGGEGQTL